MMSFVRACAISFCLATSFSLAAVPKDSPRVHAEVDLLASRKARDWMNYLNQTAPLTATQMVLAHDILFERAKFLEIETRIRLMASEESIFNSGAQIIWLRVSPNEVLGEMFEALAEMGGPRTSYYLPAIDLTISSAEDVDRAFNDFQTYAQVSEFLVLPNIKGDPRWIDRLIRKIRTQTSANVAALIVDRRLLLRQLSAETQAFVGTVGWDDCESNLGDKKRPGL